MLKVGLAVQIGSSLPQQRWGRLGVSDALGRPCIILCKGEPSDVEHRMPRGHMLQSSSGRIRKAAAEVYHHIYYILFCSSACSQGAGKRERVLTWERVLSWQNAGRMFFASPRVAFLTSNEHTASKSYLWRPGRVELCGDGKTLWAGAGANLLLPFLFWILGTSLRAET